MATIKHSKKSCSINPLKSSAPLGAALAYLGVEGAVPLFHGSQGCTSFALVLAVRHFKEAIPLQTTAMNEAATVLGGAENMQEALLNVTRRMKPKFIGVASTALVETRGEDFVGELKTIRKRCDELNDVHIAFASTPDFDGGLEEGWAKATTAILEEMVGPSDVNRTVPHINLLPGVHQTPGDIEELRRIIGLFGMDVTVLPDISTSLDGTVPDDWTSTSLGGTSAQDIAGMGAAAFTIAIGEHMRGPAAFLEERTGVPHRVLSSATGLVAADELVEVLMELSGSPPPAVLVRERSRLVDALMDAHFWYSGKKVALAADPDLLLPLSALVADLGGDVVVAISSTKGSAALHGVPTETVQVGDLFDLEKGAEEHGADLLITHSHGRMAAERLGIPLFRVGFPVFDRLGAQDRCTVGYRGTRSLAYAIANVFMEAHDHEHEEEHSADAEPGFTEVHHAHA